MFKECNKANYRKGRTDKIKYIVIHYTAGNGDTAKNNVDYYANNAVSASAHYFVDENEVWQSVPDFDTAWAVGGTKIYKHPECRNANSISVELCSRNKIGGGRPAADGGWYFKEETVKNAANLVRELMKKYDIPPQNVIRHYDVWNKICPAPFVNSAEQWERFKEMIEMTELVSVNDIVWELAELGVISDKKLWLKKLADDQNAYWLARKAVNRIRNMSSV